MRVEYFVNECVSWNCVAGLVAEVFRHSVIFLCHVCEKGGCGVFCSKAVLCEGKCDVW